MTRLLSQGNGVVKNQYIHCTTKYIKVNKKKDTGDNNKKHDI
ncbi:MAG: hypothetical protein Greene041662_305 [Candidatus Peregrinibacteria bacterium Greene0416_62]|nr:MAG: hypothetical protein Greene041662_305 [Candidatus Peregrinibacteria bacterium Greene0416_62]TSC98761.1 MAG: hypothetical protein Greene101449_830 [Candidatus Peregrinibacteria bacterium Greene1014_49]